MTAQHVDYRHASFTFDAGEFLGTLVPNTAKIMNLDLIGSIPEVAQALDGWEVVSHQVIPAGDVCFLSLLMRQVTAVPDSLEELGDA